MIRRAKISAVRASRMRRLLTFLSQMWRLIEGGAYSSKYSNAVVSTRVQIFRCQLFVSFFNPFVLRFLFHIQEHNLADPMELLYHSFMEEDDLKYWRNFLSKTNFYTRLGESKVVVCQFLPLMSRSTRTVIRCVLNFDEHHEVFRNG